MYHIGLILFLHMFPQTPLAVFVAIEKFENGVEGPYYTFGILIHLKSYGLLTCLCDIQRGQGKGKNE